MLNLEEEREKNKKAEWFYFWKKISNIITYFIICIIIIWIYKNINVTKNVEYVSLNNIQSPKQARTSGNINKVINEWNVEINYVAQYKVTGRVVDVQDYYGYDLQNKLSPRDVGLTWGELAKEKNHSNLTWSSLGNRFLSWRSSNSEWIKEMGGVNEITKCYSNNHLIPSDDKNKKLIKKIKEGDFVRIEGYLVNIYSKKSDGSYFYWNTSTSRSDSGDGACEVIYVTNVVWLQKK